MSRVVGSLSQQVYRTGAYTCKAEFHEAWIHCGNLLIGSVKVDLDPESTGADLMLR